MNVETVAPAGVIAKRRAVQVRAIQFTRGRGGEVADFARSLSVVGNVKARNGGSYVSIQDYENNLRLRVGDWLVLDADGELRKYDSVQFGKLFSSK